MNIWHWFTFYTYVCIFVEKKIKKKKVLSIFWALLVRPTYFIPTTISRNSNLSSIFIGPSCSYQISIFWSINGGSIILSGEICLGQNHLRAGTANQTKINCVFSSLQIVFYGPPFLSQLFPISIATRNILGTGMWSLSIWLIFLYQKSTITLYSHLFLFPCISLLFQNKSLYA